MPTDEQRAALTKELLRMKDEDQAARRPGESAARMSEVDRRNTARMKAIVDERGWPGRSLVGLEGAEAAWILVQHADLDRDFQRRCLPLLEDAERRHDADGRHLAYLTDRVRVGEGKPQRYGTQFHEVDGVLVPHPIEDVATLDERRSYLGLEPMADYVQMMWRTHHRPVKGP